MGLYRSFISLLLFSTLGLMFIYILQVNDMELNAAKHWNYGNGSQATRQSRYSLTDHVGKNTAAPADDIPGMQQQPKERINRPRHRHWGRVKFSALTERLHVFGVYLDDRFQPDYFLRILILQQGYNLTERLACKAEGQTVNTWAEGYEMCENHGKKYSGWIYSCLVSHDPTPDLHSVLLNVYSKDGSLRNSQPFSVTLLRSDPHTSTSGSSILSNNIDLGFKVNPDQGLGSQHHNMPNYNGKVPIKTNHRANVSIGVCVPPLHGNIYIQNLIDFLEICWILGANQVFLYIHDLPNDLLHTLSLYLRDKSHLYDIISWDLPANIKPKSYQVIWNNGQLLAVQHCLYQNMANFDWLLFLDIDEMLIPKSVHSWQDLLPTILKGSTNNVAALNFESAFFTWDFDNQISSPIKYLQHLHRTKRTTVLHSKLLVQTRNVFEVGIHHLSRAVRDSMIVIRVPAEVALLHHYRACLKRETEGIQCDLLVKDTTALKYETQLTARRDQINKWSQIVNNSTQGW